MQEGKASWAFVSGAGWGSGSHQPWGLQALDGVFVGSGGFGDGLPDAAVGTTADVVAEREAPEDPSIDVLHGGKSGTQDKSGRVGDYL